MEFEKSPQKEARVKNLINLMEKYVKSNFCSDENLHKKNL